MAQPYQDLQGNWFTDGRPMTPQESAAMGIPAQAVAQAPVAQPGAITPQQMLEAQYAEAARSKRIGLNPIGAMVDFFRK